MPADDLLRLPGFRRVLISTLLSGLGGQVTVLAMSLTAALLLKATAFQMGLLTAIESLPFLLFSLPAGVWLDRVRKLPVYVAGEWTIATVLASVPLAWAFGVLTLTQLCAVAFVLGCVTTVAGSASQLVLMQVVPRECLVDAHARSAMATATAEIAGPGLAGVLIRLTGAPLALAVDAAMLVVSALIVRRVGIDEKPAAEATVTAFLPQLAEGMRFVRRHRLLWPLALVVAGWQFCLHAALAVQILFANRTLQLSEQAIGFAYVGIGVGSALGSVVGGRISRLVGPGPTLIFGLALTAIGWALPPLASGALAVAAFSAMLFLVGFGGVLVFVNFLAVRQAVTPERLLGRMTATMRWLVVAPGVPGALLGGWIGEHMDLGTPLLAAGGFAAALAVAASLVAAIRGLKALPSPPADGR